MRAWHRIAVAALAGAAYVAVLRAPGVGAGTVDAVGEVGQLVAAVVGTLGCAVAARRVAGHRRRAWTWLAIGTGSWAAGQAAWSFYELVLHTAVPFPSIADLGYLGFPIAAGRGLILWLGVHRTERAARGRDLLDGAIIAGSLLALSWVTALGTVVSGGLDDGWFPFLLSLAYPLGDVVTGTLVLIALARGAATERGPLWILALGLAGVATADSTFVYLASTSAYSSGNLFSSGGWVLGFLLVGVAGWSVRHDQRSGRRARVADRRLALDTTRLQLSLPYVPLTAALVVLGASRLRLSGALGSALVFGVALVAMVLLRQFLAVVDNQRLLVQLGEARDELERRASHDALTGLPNRVLLSERLERALADPVAEVAVLYCDLDDFKPVNDHFGHDAGDRLLVEVARRLGDSVRTTDTVARLGGDEFAVLLDDDQVPELVAQRILTAMSAPVELGPELGPQDGSLSTSTSVAVSMSIGIARHQQDRHLPGDAAGEVLRTADAAMYAAKAAGKGRVVSAHTRAGAPEPVPVST